MVGVIWWLELFGGWGYLVVGAELLVITLLLEHTTSSIMKISYT